MKRVILSAFACDPTKGSEAGNGWNWATGLAAAGLDVHCLTRATNKLHIEAAEVPKNLSFYYIELPGPLKSFYSLSQMTMYVYYIYWQWLAYRSAKKIDRRVGIQHVHHVTWGSIQMGSFLYKLKRPFLFGPCGGGQKSPVAFRGYFLNHWASETRRESVSQLLQKYNPACRNMLKASKVVMASNHDTIALAKDMGATNIEFSLDGSIPENYLDNSFLTKIRPSGKLKLLWVGRFMPRKGLLLVLDVMKELKALPDITLTVVGDGELRPEIEATIREHQLSETVHLTGMVPHSQVKQYYMSHDLLFITSLRDSGPVQLIEAMANGMPVITIDLHGQGIIVDGRNGIKCPCETPGQAIHALKNTIISLSEDPSRVSEMAKCAYAYASKQTWENKLKMVIDKYYN